VRITIRVEAEVHNADEERSLLQLLRTWEREHQHVQMAILVNAPTQSAREAEDIMLSLDPSFPHINTRPR
jgi:hypothetical protein